MLLSLPGGFADLRKWLAPSAMASNTQGIVLVDLVQMTSYEMEVEASETIASLKAALQEELNVETVRIFFEHSKSPYTKMNSRVVTVFKDHTRMSYKTARPWFFGNHIVTQLARTT